MKIRSGFVSNSSSSSFVLFGLAFDCYGDEMKELYDYIEKRLKPEDIEEFKEIVGPDSENIDSYGELMEYLYHEVPEGFEVDSGYDGDPIVIGIDPISFPDDKTVGETKKYITDTLGELGFTGKVGWHEACYYNG